MPEQNEIPKFSEGELAGKKEKLKSAIELMFNFQRSKKIKESLMPHLDELTVDEVDYILEYIRYLDNQVLLEAEGPFSDVASALLVENEKNLKEFEEKIDPDRVRELKSYLGADKEKI